MQVEHIERKIYLIRGMKVMVDRDLAQLYGVETRVLNQAVRRNMKRFPEDFMFSLTREEIMNLSQSVISSKIKHAPNVFVFTEQGVAMLSSVLNSERAIQVNIHIMRVFIKMREMLSQHPTREEFEHFKKELLQKIETTEKKYDAQFHAVFEAIKQLVMPVEKTNRKIGF